MIDEICDLLEDQLGWSPVEDSTGPVSYRVIYDGMEAAEDWEPTVRELYRVALWVDELSSARLTQNAIQDAARLAFTHVSELLNASVSATIVTEETNTENDEASIELIFRTVDARSEWE